MPKPLVKNAADPQQVKKAGREERFARRMELEDIKVVMDSPAGRRLMWRIINKLCHFDASSAEHSGSMTYLNEGERNIGRVLKSDICEAAFEEYQNMEKEYWKTIMDEKKEENNGDA